MEVVTSAGGSDGTLEKMSNEGLALRVPPVEKMPEQVGYSPRPVILYVAVVALNPT